MFTMAKEAKETKKLKITLRRSLIGRPETQRKVVYSLGLRKTNHSVEQFDTPIIRGMLSAVGHLLTVEEI
jgi:large subunit ribosomal protein L30